MNETNDLLHDNIRRVSVLLRRRGMKQHGNIPSTQNRALSILKLNDGLSQRQLAYVLGIRPQSSGEIVGKMEKSGWLTRQTDDKDSRVNRLFLTAEGRKMADKIDAQLENNDILDCLTDEEKQQLNTLLTKVVENSYEQEDSEDFEFRMPPRFQHPRMEARRMPFEMDDGLKARRQDFRPGRRPHMEGRNVPFDEDEEERDFRKKRII